MSSKKAIFIGACPRSGTTMMGTELARLPGCVTTPESQFKFDLIRLQRQGADSEQMIAAVKQSRRFKVWNLQVDWPALLAGIDGELTASKLMFALVDLYARQHGNIEGDWDTWIDHTPGNCKHSQQLFAHFPSSRFVHLVRDGRAVFASVKWLDWGPSTGKACAQWWLLHVAQGLATESAHPSRSCRIRYEDFLADPQAELQNLAANLGLDYSPHASKSGGFTLPKHTLHQHKLVGKKIDAGRAQAWESKLQAKDIRQFESLTENLLAILGYEPKFIDHSTSRAERWSSNLTEFWQLISKQLRFRLRWFITLRAIK